MLDFFFSFYEQTIPLCDSFFLLFFPHVVSFPISSQIFARRSYNELLAFCNSLRSDLIQG